MFRPAALLAFTIASFSLPAFAAQPKPGVVAVAQRLIKKLAQTPQPTIYSGKYRVSALNDFHPANDKDVAVGVGEDGKSVIVQVRNQAYLKDVHDVVVGNRRGGSAYLNGMLMFNDELSHRGEKVQVQTR